jgi:hypothetical protein
VREQQRRHAPPASGAQTLPSARAIARLQAAKCGWHSSPPSRPATQHSSRRRWLLLLTGDSPGEVEQEALQGGA